MTFFSDFLKTLKSHVFGAAGGFYCVLGLLSTRSLQKCKKIQKSPKNAKNDQNFSVTQKNFLKISVTANFYRDIFFYRDLSYNLFSVSQNLGDFIFFIVTCHVILYYIPIHYYILHFIMFVWSQLSQCLHLAELFEIPPREFSSDSNPIKSAHCAKKAFKKIHSRLQKSHVFSRNSN